MRIAYYTLPENITEDIAINEMECSYEEFESGYTQTSVKYAKELIKKYGGSGSIEHYDRDGSFIGATPITIKGNNSKFKYNRHL